MENIEKLISDIYQDYIKTDLAKDKTPEQVEKAVLDIYNNVNKHFEINESKRQVRFAYNDFISNMLYRALGGNTTTHKVTPRQMQTYIDLPLENYEQLQRASLYFYLTIQEYRNIIDYKSNSLTYSNVVRVRNVESFNKKDFVKNLTFIKDYNVASKFGLVTKSLFRDDVFYGYEMSDNSKHYVWKKLPNEYCRLIGRDDFGVYKFEFNFSFFDAFPEAKSAYPSEFTKIYNSLKGNKWAELNSSRSFAFKLDDTINKPVPYFIGLFLDLARLMDIKNVDLASSISDNYKLLHQEVPLNKESGREDDFLLSGEYLEQFHENLRANVPQDVGVATTPMKVTSLTLKSNVGSSEENIVNRSISNILGSSGTSKLLFSGDTQSAVGLNKNIQVDENNLFKLLRQYELFMTRRLFYYNSNTHKYWFQFLDHTYYNTEDIYNRLLKIGQFGFNTEMELASVCGISQIDFINNNLLKKELGFVNDMIPFKSAHIGNPSESDEVGGAKKESDLTEDGLKSRDRDL